MWWLLVLPCIQGKTLGAVQYVYPSDSSALQGRLAAVNSDGTPSAFSSLNSLSCVTSVGCYRSLVQPSPSIADISPVRGKTYEPQSCFNLCVSRKFSIAAVKGELCSCGHVIAGQWTKSPTNDNCNIQCTGDYTSPLCGGPDPYWNLFMCYTHTHLSSTAIDPWRSLAFSTVVVNWNRVSGTSYTAGVLPETYFLFAADLGTGKSRFQFMMPQTSTSEAEFMTYVGLQFDVDSSRIVCLMIPATVGRVTTDRAFSYKILIVKVDTTELSYPKLSKTPSPMYTDVATKLDIFATGSSQTIATNYFMGNQNSGIISKNGLDSYIFSVSYGIDGTSLYTVKSRLIFVDITQVASGADSTGSSSSFGLVYFTADLDCIVTQVAANEYYGDVGILCSRDGSMSFIAIAQVYANAFTGRLQTVNKWIPSSPTYVAPISVTQNLNLLAGVSASDHMTNSTCHGFMLYDPVGAVTTDDLTVLRNQPTGTETKRDAVPSVVCFNTQTQAVDLWGGAGGTGRTTEDGVVSTAVTLVLYQQDPGFPLSLPRPGLAKCELTMTGQSVNIDFTTVTLKGATCVDADNDGIPESVDYSTEVTTPKPANKCFAEASLIHLTGATCQFTASDKMVVNLDPRSTLTFGQTLCIKPNFVCRTSEGQWSSYATGCCEVQVPENLVAPIPNLRADPSLVIDVCADVTLDFGDTQNCGRQCFFKWKLLTVTDGTVNAVSTADQLAKMTSINAILAEANANNANSVTIRANSLAAGSFHKFQADITSMWQLTTQYLFTVQKLSQSSPTVTIIGDVNMGVFRNVPYTITSSGKASRCAEASITLGYQWQYSNCSVALDTIDTVKTQNALTIPAGSHRCDTGSAISTGWYEAQFQKIACELCVVSVTVFLLDEPARRSSQSLNVYVLKSDILARCFNPDSSQVSVGSTLYLDCSNFQDPDDTASAVFKGEFKFGCTSKTSQLPCFGASADFTASLSPCSVDQAQPRVTGADGTRQYSQVVFSEGQTACRIGRGVTAVNTNLMKGGETYTFTVIGTQLDNVRSASKSLEVQLVTLALPKISLEVIGTVYAKYPTGSIIRIQGNHDLPTVGVSDINYRFSLNLQQRRSDNNQLEYTEVSLLSDCVALGTAKWNPASPTLSVGPYCLGTSQFYQINMTLFWTEVVVGVPLQRSSFATRVVATAAGPPTNGKFTITSVDSSNIPTASTDCSLNRVFTAEEWTSVDQPLTYRFGYLVDTSLALMDTTDYNSLIATATKFWFTDAPQPVRTLTGLVKCGVKTNDYTRIVFVMIKTSADEVTYLFKQVKATPPADPALAATNILQQASGQAESNPSATYASLMSAVGLMQEANSTVQTSIANAVLATVAASTCTTVDCGDRRLIFLNTLAESLASNTGTPDVALVDTYQNTLVGALEDHVAYITKTLQSTPSDSQTQTIFEAVSQALSADIFLSIDAALGSANLQSRRLSELEGSRPLRSFGCKLPGAAKLTPSEQPLYADLPRDGPRAGEQASRFLAETAARSHHSMPQEAGEIITDCDEAYCDLPGLVCMRGVGEHRSAKHHQLVCCEEHNPTTNCLEPPCWFYGPHCPVATAAVHAAVADEARRLTGVSVAAGASFAVAGRAKRNRLQSERWWSIWARRFMEEIGNGRRLMVDDVTVAKASSRAFDSDISVIATAEAIPTQQSIALEYTRQASIDKSKEEDLRYELYLSSLSPSLQVSLRAQREAQKAQQAALRFQAERNVSQMITRIAVVRDSITHQVVKGLLTNEDPRSYDTPVFTIFIGKSTNLARVLPYFVFPQKYVVPSNSPDNPTSSNPVTGFSFAYVEYYTDIYGWSSSKPASAEAALVTLTVMRANPDTALVTSEEDEPVRVFADRLLFSNAICMRWDKFAAGTAGGEWTSRGALNDGNGCLITNTGDIGLFIDVEKRDIVKLAAPSDIPFIVLPSTANRFVVFAIVLFTLILSFVLAVWGYKFDETARDERQELKDMGAKNDGYFLDGDGIQTPLSVVDPIAYQYASTGDLKRLVFFTIVNVVKFQHVFIGAVTFHDHFSRPQRLLTATSLLLGLMAINAVIFGSNSPVIQNDQPVSGGVIAALIVFPIFWMLHLMFDLRPTPAKKKLLKRTLHTDDRDKLHEQIRQQEAHAFGAGLPMLTNGPIMATASSPTLPPPHIGGFGGLSALGGRTLLAPARPALPVIGTDAMADSAPRSPTTPPPGVAARAPPGAPPPSSPPPTMALPPIFFGKAPAPPPSRTPPTLPAPGATGGSLAFAGLTGSFSLGTPRADGTATPLDSARGAGEPNAPPTPRAGEGRNFSPEPRHSMIPPLGIVPIGQPPPQGPAGGQPRIAAPPPPGSGGARAPPPPTEEAQAFVRRVKMVYLDRVMQEHNKQELQAEQSAGRAVPEWVFTLMVVLPYVSSVAWVCMCAFLTINYSLKFTAATETRWYIGTGVSVLAVTVVLDMARCVLLAIIELRKYEIRRRSKNLEFNPRRVVKNPQTAVDPNAPAYAKPKTVSKRVLSKTSAIPAGGVANSPALRQYAAVSPANQLTGNSSRGFSPPPPPPPGAPRSPTGTPVRSEAGLSGGGLLPGRITPPSVLAGSMAERLRTGILEGPPPPPPPGAFGGTSPQSTPSGSRGTSNGLVFSRAPNVAPPSSPPSIRPSGPPSMANSFTGGSLLPGALDGTGAGASGRSTPTRQR